MNAINPALHRFGEVTVRLAVELGRTDMPLKDVLALEEGSVVPLNRQVDELLDITANGRVVARGEVVAHDGRFAIRIVSLVNDSGAAKGPVASANPNPQPDAVPSDPQVGS